MKIKVIKEIVNQVAKVNYNSHSICLGGLRAYVTQFVHQQRNKADSFLSRLSTIACIYNIYN